MSVGNESDENQYRFLTIVVLQALLMHHLMGSLISVVITYTGIAVCQYFVHEELSLDAVTFMLVWLSVSLLSTLAMYMVMSSIG